MQTEVVLYVNYLDLGNKFFQIFIIFFPLSKQFSKWISPQIDLMLRIFDAEGSPLLPFSLGLAPEYSLRIGIRKTFPIGECLQSSAKSREKEFLQREETSDLPRQHPGRATEEEFPWFSHHPLMRLRNYIQLVEKETNLSSRLVCLYDQRTLAFPNTRTTTDFSSGAAHSYFIECDCLASFCMWWY